MKSTLSRAATVLSLGFASTLLATAALADAPAQQSSEDAMETAAEQPAEGQAAASGVIEVPAITAPSNESQATDAEPQEAELICRSIRLDMSSRRKTRVCRTEEGWRQLNQQR